jgi:multicomponent Na+:H+ antiporter subunit B
MIMSLILRTTTRLLVPLMLLLSIFLLFRGHNEPGGGFIGGLVAAGAYALYAVAYGTAQARRALYFDPRSVIAFGIALAFVSGFVSVFTHQSYQVGLWYDLHLGPELEIHLSNILFFDIGVFLAVIGVALTIVFNMEEAGVRLFSKD